MLASSYGIKAISCDKMSQLEHTVDYFLNYDGPILCDFRVVTDNCLPLVAPGKGLDEMILPKHQANQTIDFDKRLFLYKKLPHT